MRTSLSYYRHCRENKHYLRNSNDFLNQMKKLSSIILKEVEEKNHCTLFDQIIEQIKNSEQYEYENPLQNWTTVSFIDAYIILSTIDWKKGSLHQIAKENANEYAKYIYQPARISMDQYISIDEKIRQVLDDYLEYAKYAASYSKQFSSYSKNSSKSHGQKIEIHDKSEASSHSIHQKKDESDQTSQNDQNIQQVPPVTPIIENRILMSEDDVAKLAEERMQLRIHSANNVKAFNERFDQLDDDILKIQESATKVVNQVINFKQELTNNYILQFAQSLIDLYDMIADSYDYHRNNIETTDDSNYRNAIFNYETFLEEIIDKLSYLGVRTIISEPGESLNGSYHHVVNTQSFSSKAVVNKSVRAGFMYKDRMLRKERIEVK